MLPDSQALSAPSHAGLAFRAEAPPKLVALGMRQSSLHSLALEAELLALSWWKLMMACISVLGCTPKPNMCSAWYAYLAMQLLHDTAAGPRQQPKELTTGDN